MKLSFLLPAIRFLVALLTLLAAFIGGSPVQAAPSAVTFTVNSTADAVDVNIGDGVCADATGACTLRAVIQEANALPGADAITLPAGTYILTIPGINENAGATGDLDIREDLTLTGAGQDVTIIHGNGAVTGDGVLHIPHMQDLNPVTVSISGVTVTGGVGHGGAIHNSSSGILTVTDVTISGNTGESGVLTNHRELTVINSTISGNTATRGGGIHSGAIMTIIGSTISGNTSTNGGGGGIHNHGAATIIGSTVSGNTGAEGGGIHNHDMADLTIINSTISGNTAPALGGGGIRNMGNLAIYSSTIAGNTGAGGGINQDASMGMTTIQNSIVASNTTNGMPGTDCSGTLNSTGYNLVGNNDGCTFIAAPGDQVGTPASPIDPLLGPLQDNGGSTLTHALLTGSPAIDAGNPSGCTDDLGNLLTTDQRSFPRPLDGNGDGNAICDSGAFESDDIPPAPGTLRGYVSEAINDTPIAGATVTAGGFSTLTTANGSYQILDLPPGTYDVTASAAGYLSKTVTGVVILAGGTTTQDFVLEPGCLSSCLRSTSISLRAGVADIRGRVTVKDENGLVVSGASVSATWTLPDGSTINQMRNTAITGVAGFKIADAGPGTYTLTLTNITKTGYTFDPANSMLSASITK